MKLSTGKIAFPLQFDNGDVENIFINPHDAGLQERIKGFETSIHKRLQKISIFPSSHHLKIGKKYLNF